MADVDKAAKAISDAANVLLEKYQEDIELNAANNPNTPFVIPQAEIDEVIEAIKDSNESIRQEAIDDYVSRRGDGNYDDSIELKEKFDSEIEYFIVKNINDGINRIHGASIASQIFDADRESETNDAAERSQNTINVVAVTAIGTALGFFARSIAMENGWTFYRRLTARDDVVRDEHSERDGKVFVYGQERSIHDTALAANHCRCQDLEITEEEAREGEFFYPEDRRFLSTAEARKNNSVNYPSMNKFNIKSESGTVHVSVIGFIDEWDNNDYQSFKSKVETELSNKKDTLEIDVTSHGGMAFDGMAMFSFLKALPNRVVANVYGFAGSAATMILAAADYVTASETDTILLHEAANCACGTGDQLISVGEETNTVTEMYAKAYASKTGKTVEDLLEIMKADQYVSADKAKEIGIVDEIRKISKTASAQAQKPKEVKAMSKDKDEGLEQRLSKLEDENKQLKAENEQLTQDLAVEKSKAAAAEANSDDDVDEAELRKQVRAEIEQEMNEKSEIAKQIEACGLKVEGDSVKEMLTSAVEQGGGLTDGLDESGLKAVFNSIKAMRSSKEVQKEYTGVTGANKTDNVTSIHDQINKQWGTR